MLFTEAAQLSLEIEKPAMAVQQMLSLAVQDITQVALVISCVFVGWFVWAVLLQLLDPIKAASAKTKAKLAELGQTMVDTRTKMDSKLSVEADKAIEPAPVTGLTLLEHYGVFGVKPGVWSSTER
mmetsp:Transcript_46931/g.87377  ORF Transcript_46931/g.87377 Transcript_46931/m.87377 type:complete len:125 (+) Transcript_46931:159-533(+)